MEWAHVTVDTKPDSIEQLAQQLAVAGYDALEIEDERELNAIAAQNEKIWGAQDEEIRQKLSGVCRIGLYIENDHDLPGRLRALERELRRICAAFPDTDFGSLFINKQIVNDKQWEGKWEEYYIPTPVGRKWMILPEWDRDAPTLGRLPLVLSPGATFGTGTHATTAMCLSALEGLLHGGERVLDLGCGSGVLSIAALLLGAQTVDGVDIDPLAVSVSRANAELNGFFSERYRALHGDILSDGALLATLAQRPYDLVLANIVADVLLDLAPKVPSLLKSGGRLLCSGIIAEREGEVLCALEAAGFVILSCDTRDGWNSILCG